MRDFDAGNRMLLIRNRKDPRKKKGNDPRIPLLDDPLERHFAVSANN
ncbi:hypothetical protein [Bradyrhizobium sp. SZCCHNPS1003]|nr:hypothetical protein [Bradyrhizobium sp. SZCCHNPS1003]